jgi:hypothetical protein
MIGQLVASGLVATIPIDIVALRLSGHGTVPPEMLDAIKIITLCIVAAALFGVIHDQVNARICVEYFTIGHPDILGNDSTAVLGLFWGVAATWWVGLLLGIPLAFVSLRGPAEVRNARSLARSYDCDCAPCHGRGFPRRWRYWVPIGARRHRRPHRPHRIEGPRGAPRRLYHGPLGALGELHLWVRRRSCLDLAGSEGATAGWWSRSDSGGCLNPTTRFRSNASGQKEAQRMATLHHGRKAISLARRLGTSALLVCVAGCASRTSSSSNSTQPRQCVRVVDEAGEPVAGAEVRMLDAPLWARRVASSAWTDELGCAFFETEAVHHYEARAVLPTRRSVAAGEGLDHMAVSVDRPVALTLRELEVGAVQVPGEVIVTSKCYGWGGYALVSSTEVPRELTDRWPDATWLCGFNGSGQAPSALDLELDVHGFAPTVVALPLVPVTQFEAPMAVDAAALEPWPWVTGPVVLRDPDGAALPTTTLRAARSLAHIWRLLEPDQERRYRRYPLTSGAGGSRDISLPCGSFELRMDCISSFGSGALRWQSTVGPLTVKVGAVGLDVTLPVVLRDVRVRLEHQGDGPRSSSVKARTASGFEGSWVSESDGVVTLLLPLGQVDLTLEVHGPTGEFWRLERTIDVTEAPLNEVVWTAP